MKNEELVKVNIQQITNDTKKLKGRINHAIPPPIPLSLPLSLIKLLLIQPPPPLVIPVIIYSLLSRLFVNKKRLSIVSSNNMKACLAVNSPTRP